MSTIRELTEERKGIWEQAKRLLDAAEAEKRDLTGVELHTYNQLSEKLESLRSRIDRLTEQADTERDVAESLRKLGLSSLDGGAQDSTLAEELRSAVLNRTNNPIVARMAEPMSGINTRALTTTGNVGTTFYNQLVRHMVEGSAVLSAGATLLVTESGEPLKIPRTTADSAATIVPEGDPIPESNPTLGNATLGAYKYGFLTSITRELAEDNKFDLVGYMAAQTGAALGNGLGAHLVTGTGTGQPTGIVSTATTGKTGGAGVTGKFTADDLIDLYHSLAAPYARSSSAAWLMRNTTLAEVRKLKDTQGRYLFDIDVPMGYPGASGSLLGRPVFVDPTVPAIALGAKSVLFGDMSKVWVRHVNGVRFERSDEYGFNRDTIWFRGLLRADGALVDNTGAIKAFTGNAA